MPPEPPLDSLRLVIESILFVAARPVEVGLLARITGRQPEEVESAVAQIAADFESRGLRLQRNGAAVQFVTAPEATPYVQSFLGVDEDQRLTRATLVALTVIAYKQPITRPALERILGKNCEWAIASLKARELITEVGRAAAPGRPYLYGTTFRFLEHFGLAKPEDLPPLPELESLGPAAAEPEGEDSETPDESPAAGDAAAEKARPDPWA
jgi:segregation and condensation protein B